MSIKYHAMSNMKYALYGASIGFILNFLAAFLAGAGHGTYIPLFVFFAPLFFLSFPAVCMGGTFLYSGYAILMGCGNRRNKGTRIVLILAFLHLVAVGAIAIVSPDEWNYEMLHRALELAPIFTVGTFVLFALALLLSFYAAAKTRVILDDVPHCRKCKYNLTGNTSGVCPECGEEIKHDLGENPCKVC